MNLDRIYLLTPNAIQLSASLRLHPIEWQTITLISHNALINGAQLAAKLQISPAGMEVVLSHLLELQLISEPEMSLQEYESYLAQFVEVIPEDDDDFPIEGEPYPEEEVLVEEAVSDSPLDHREEPVAEQHVEPAAEHQPVAEPPVEPMAEHQPVTEPPAEPVAEHQPVTEPPADPVKPEGDSKLSEGENLPLQTDESTEKTSVFGRLFGSKPKTNTTPTPVVKPKTGSVKLNYPILPVMDFVRKNSGEGLAGHLAVYKMFLNVPQQLLEYSAWTLIDIENSQAKTDNQNLALAFIQAAEKVVGIPAPAGVGI